MTIMIHAMGGDVPGWRADGHVDKAEFIKSLYVLYGDDETFLDIEQGVQITPEEVQHETVALYMPRDDDGDYYEDAYYCPVMPDSDAREADLVRVGEPEDWTMTNSDMLYERRRGVEGSARND